MPVKNISCQKTQLRARYKKLRAQCPKELKQELDRKLAKRVLSLEEYKRSETLLCFVSSPIECDTWQIIEAALADGKRVAVPKCREKGAQMDFYIITSQDQLSPGHFSIMEPDSDKCARLEDFSGGLCVVPGLCFDYEGYRVGFGKGYYDRFLSGFSGITVGICYSRYVLSAVPRSEYDVGTDILVTEKYICRNKRD